MSPGKLEKVKQGITQYLNSSWGILKTFILFLSEFRALCRRLGGEPLEQGIVKAHCLEILLGRSAQFLKIGIFELSKDLGG